MTPKRTRRFIGFAVSAALVATVTAAETAKPMKRRVLFGVI